MDPNATLSELRSLTQRYEHQRGTLGPTQLSRMVELLTALDEWLLAGGFLPEDWQR